MARNETGGMFGGFVGMDVPTVLTIVLYRIRARKPEAQISEESGIAPSQLHKYRSGHDRPHVDEWAAIIRSVYEVDPDGAQMLVAAAIPVELYQVLDLGIDPSSLQAEVLQASAAAGRVAELFERATRDGMLDNQEMDDLEEAYGRLEREAAEGKAAIQHMRGKGKGKGQTDECH